MALIGARTETLLRMHGTLILLHSETRSMWQKRGLKSGQGMTENKLNEKEAMQKKAMEREKGKQRSSLSCESLPC